jgi:hypothetical protein
MLLRFPEVKVYIETFKLALSAVEPRIEKRKRKESANLPWKFVCNSSSYPNFPMYIEHKRGAKAGMEAFRDTCKSMTLLTRAQIDRD